MSDSIAAFTAPHDATVVTTANSAEDPIPKRVSLPSRFGPCDAGRVHRGGARVLRQRDDDDGREEHTSIAA